LAAIPLGALRKAQRELAHTQVEDDDVSEDGMDPESEAESIPAPEVKRAEKPEWSAKPRTDIPKRKDKNASV
jgi:ribosomal RNA-processing protein 36